MKALFNMLAMKSRAILLLAGKNKSVRESERHKINDQDKIHEQYKSIEGKKNLIRRRI